MTQQPTLWRAITGPTVWLTCLVAVYTAHALGCRYIDVRPAWAGLAEPPTMVTLVVFIAWSFFLVAAVLLGWQSWAWLRRQAASRADPVPPHKFMTRFTFVADVSAIVAILATGLPIGAVPACI